MTSPIIRPEPFPHPSTPRVVPLLRVGDVERTRTCEVLSSHYSQGRLEPEELEERLAAAMAARTQAELARLVADLPRPDPQPGPVPARSARPTSGVAVVAGLVLAGSLFVCLMMIFVAMAIAPGWGISALVGGTVAATGGVALGVLWSRRPAQPPSSRDRMPWAK